MTESDVSSSATAASTLARDAEIDAQLTIGDLEARTGVPTSTLRAWERRIGFPQPVRSSGGQRRYRTADAVLIERVQAERARGLSLTAAVDAARRSQEVGAGSLYARLRSQHPEVEVLRVSFKVMRALTSAIEDECLAHASAPVLFGGFQNQRSYEIAGARWRELARGATAATVFADFPTTEAGRSPARIALPEDSPMLNEWSLICDDPHLSVVLVALELPRLRSQPGPRRFEAVLATDPVVVREAARFCTETARAAGLAHLERLGAHLATGVAEDPRRTTSLLRRFALYADQ